MKKGSNLLLFMMGLYLVLALLAVFYFSSASNKEELAVNDTPALQGMVVGTVNNEEPTVPAKDEDLEATKEPAAEKPDTPAEDTEPVTQEEEPAPIEETEPEPVIETPADDDGIHYYRFMANHSSEGLRIRKDPSMNGRIIGRLSPGSEGFVVEMGDEWSEIVPDSKKKLRGYSYNKYLSFEEVSANAFPEDLRKEVEAKRGE